MTDQLRDQGGSKTEAMAMGAVFLFPAVIFSPTQSLFSSLVISAQPLA
jgi:hypothetical protein